MEPTGIITDSTADLPAGIRERYGIGVVPLSVTVAGEMFPDGSVTRAATAGASVEQVVEAAEAVRDRVQLIVGLDKLDNLARGGRIGKVTAFLGGMLNMRITFCVRDGVFHPLARARGSHAILQRSLEWVAEQMGGSDRGAFCVMHAMAADKAEWLREAIEERFDVAEMHVTETGTVIATHTGTGFGVAFVPLD